MLSGLFFTASLAFLGLNLNLVSAVFPLKDPAKINWQPIYTYFTCPTGSVDPPLFITTSSVKQMISKADSYTVVAKSKDAGYGMFKSTVQYPLYISKSTIPVDVYWIGEKDPVKVKEDRIIVLKLQTPVTSEVAHSSSSYGQALIVIGGMWTLCREILKDQLFNDRLTVIH